MMRSTNSVAAWRGSISLFKGLSKTQPSAIHENITWMQAIKFLAPAELQLVHQKEDGLFFLPTSLRDAPLVGLTLEKAKASRLPVVGKMRSACHVVAGTMLKLDLDGVTEDALACGLERLTKQQIAYILYSTHSQGLKPGVRARLILPLDTAVSPQNYRRITCSASEALFGKVLDQSEGFLHQLAGCAATHPDRRNCAFQTYKSEGYCLSADALLEDYLSKHPAKQLARSQSQSASVRLLPPFERAKIAEALEWIDAGNYQSWCRTGMMLKAAGLDEHGLDIWLAFSKQAPSASRQREHEGQYDPKAMWDRFSPCVSSDVAVATLFARARDAASDLVSANLRSGVLDAKTSAAIKYLHTRHPAHCRQLVAPFTKNTR